MNKVFLGKGGSDKWGAGREVNGGGLWGKGKGRGWERERDGRNKDLANPFTSTASANKIFQHPLKARTNAYHIYTMVESTTLLTRHRRILALREQPGLRNTISEAQIPTLPSPFFEHYIP